MRLEDYERGYFVATQRAISRAELGLPLVATPAYDAWLDRQREQGYELIPYRTDTVPMKELRPVSPYFEQAKTAED